MVPTGQDELEKIPKEYRNKFTIDNKGNLIYKNRAFRRNKPPTDNWETKNSHAIQTKRRRIRERAEYEKRKENREKIKHN